MRRLAFSSALLFAFAVTAIAAEDASESASPWARWERGPSKDASYFPIAVWLQQPQRAPRFQALGINLYVGLWKGPTEQQLTELRHWHMPVMCAQNDYALAHLNDPLFVGWTHPDEPDNAQSRGEGKGFGPPVLPAEIVKRYDEIRAADPTRPVLLNLGSGAAVDGLSSRGVRAAHPEDYAEYLKGCDVASYAVYPAGSGNTMIGGKLDLVGRGAARLVDWGHGEKIVWAVIETARGSGGRNATPRQVKAEVWMAIVNGARGIVYFVHEFQPKFSESAILEDRDMSAGVTALNAQVRDLAAVINAPAPGASTSVKSENSDVPVQAMTRRAGGATYVFAAAAREGATKATFTVPGIGDAAKVEVLGESRTLETAGGHFTDAFSDWDVHLYRVTQ